MYGELKMKINENETIKTNKGNINFWTNEGDYWTYKITCPKTNKTLYEEYYYSHEHLKKAFEEAINILMELVEKSTLEQAITDILKVKLNGN